MSSHFFNPIAYEEGDKRSYRLLASADICHGMICAFASSDMYTQYCKPAGATIPHSTATNMPTASIMQYASYKGKYFPVYAEKADPENVSATLSNNDYVIGFFGREWEVHEDATRCGAASFTQGGLCCVATNYKWTQVGVASGLYTNVILAQCVGTKNGWVKMRRL